MSDSVFYFRFYQPLHTRLPSQSPRQCSQKRLIGCANFGNFVFTELGNVVLRIVGDFDLEGHVSGALLAMSGQPLQLGPSRQFSRQRSCKSQ
jgi:hypothetical protein